MTQTLSSALAQRASSLRHQVVGIDTLVPLLDGSSRPYIYLDNASSTPTLRGVQQKVNGFLEWYSSVHRGSGFKSLIATHAYQQAREIVARFVGADPASHSVVFGKNSTEAINKLANRLEFRPGEVVLTTAMEHHSNDLPWRPKAQVEYVGTDDSGLLDLDDYRRKLERFGDRIRLVAVTGASNITGIMPPIYDMAELAHRQGAMVMADCAQLAPHRAVHMGSLRSPRRLDFVVVSAHKMYAPFGTGALIGPRDFFAQGAPDYRGGGTIDLVTLDEVYWTDPPERDEAGSPNVLGAVALAASIQILTEVGMDAIAAHEMELTSYALRKLKALEGIRLYGPCDPECLERRLGVIAFSVDGIPHAKVAAILGFEGGIGVRNGHFCAQPYLLRLLGVSDDEYRATKQRVLRHDRCDVPGLVRASFGCYNTFEEVDFLAEMLGRVLRGAYQGDYLLEAKTGQYLPRSFDAASLSRYFAL